MKQFYLAVCCLCIGLISNAQFNKGQKMIGGLFYYNLNINQSNNITYDNSSSGAQLSYSRFRNTMSFYSIGLSYNYYANTSTDHSFGYGLNYGYTQLQTLAKKFYLGVSGSGSINQNQSKNYNNLGNLISKTNGWGIEAIGNVGIYYQLNQRFLLSTNLINLITIRYGHDQTNSLDANNNFNKTNEGNSWTINTGLTGFSVNNLGIGVKYLLK